MRIAGQHVAADMPALSALFDLGAVVLARRLQHHLGDDAAQHAQTHVPRPHQAGEGAGKLRVLDDTFCRSAAISCDLRETRTGSGGGALGGSAWMYSLVSTRPYWHTIWAH